MNQNQQELYEKLLKKVNEFCLGQAAEDVIAAIDALVENYERLNHLPTPETKAKIDSLLLEPSEPLKALEIIKKYISIKVDEDDFIPYYIKDEQYVSSRSCKVMSKEEYELLKEALKDAR